MAGSAVHIEDLKRDLTELAERLEDTNPSAAFSLKEGACYFTEIPFKLPLHPAGGGVRFVEVSRIYHGTPKGRFLLSLSATPSPNPHSMRATALERTLRACLHDLSWSGADLQVGCDTRNLSPELRTQLRKQVHAEIAKRKTNDLLEFVLPWRRLVSESKPESEEKKHLHSDFAEVVEAARKLGISSAVDLYENALLSVFPTVCAARGLRIGDCGTMIRGRGSWAFRIAEAVRDAFDSTVRVELGGRRYRPAHSKPRPSPSSRAQSQQGRWETDEKEGSSHSEVLVLLGGGDPITAENAPEIRASVVFHIHRDSLTAEGERVLRERGILVVPHILLSSAEELAASQLADPQTVRALVSAGPDDLAAISQDLRAAWRAGLLGAWERVMARSRDDQCSPQSATVRIAAERLAETLKARVRKPGVPASSSSEPPAGESEQSGGPTPPDEGREDSARSERPEAPTQE